MSSTTTFIGSGFSLESVSQISLATVRVRFTQDPLAVNPTGSTDALNIKNYVLSGPGPVQITVAGVVANDPQGIDLFLSGPLAAGIWTLTASGIHETTGTVLMSPMSLSFTAAIQQALEGVSKGATDYNEFDTLRTFLNPTLKGKGWTALLEAIATGDKTNNDNVKLAFDQLFTSSASGLYLNRLAADNGVAKPAGIGILDPLFREYAIRTTNGKLTEESLLEVLEIFYGSNAVRANDVSYYNEPYLFQDGDNLSVLVDEKQQIETVFTASDFAIQGAARATEVAVALTRSFRSNQSTAFAIAVKDPITGSSNVKIYSGALGLSSSIRVTGGKAQNQLAFSSQLPVFTTYNLNSGSSFAYPTWTITFSPITGRVRFQPAVFGTTLNPDLSQLRIGDYVNLFGSGINPANQGSYPVVNVLFSYDPTGVNVVEYFEVANLFGVSQSFQQVAIQDITYFRPVKTTSISSSGQNVIVAVPGDFVNIELPATSQAVGRRALTAAYGQDNVAVVIQSLQRSNGMVQVQANGHGLSVGSQVRIDGVQGQLAIPATTTGQFTTSPYASDSSAATICSTIPSPAQGFIKGVTALIDGVVYYGGGRVENTGTFTTNPKNTTFKINDQNIVNGRKVVDFQFNPYGSSTPLSVYAAGFSLGSVLRATTADRIVATGGINSTCQANTQLWDTLSGNWIDAGKNLFIPRAAHKQSTLLNGNIIVTGGITTPTSYAISSVEIWDGNTGIWALVTPMLVPRADHEQVILSDGTVLVVGGRQLTSGHYDYSSATDMGPITQHCEIYNPTANTWTDTGIMSYTRFQHKLVIVGDFVYAIGGVGNNPTQPASGQFPIPVMDIERWDRNTGVWSKVAKLAYGRDSVVAKYLPGSNRIFIAGGSISTQVEILDLNTGKMSLSNARFTAVRPFCSAIVLPNDNVLVVGGLNGNTTTTASNFYLYIPNNDQFLAGGLNGTFEVASVPDQNNFTYATDIQTYTLNGSATATATPVAAATGTIPGPFVFDPDNGLAITAIESNTTVDLFKGHQYGVLNISDSSQFPDAPGYLVLSFGYSNQVAPIKYYGRFSETELSIDYSFVFPENVPAGSTCTYLAQKAPFVPATPEAIGAFYLTPSPAGRVAAEEAINSSVGFGNTVNIKVVYPGDRGIANEGYPTSGNYKVSGVVACFAGDDVDAEVALAESTNESNV